MWSKVKCFFSDPFGTKRMLDDFMERFPGRCPICSFHRYGFQEGHEKNPIPPFHNCIEASDETKRVREEV